MKLVNSILITGTFLLLLGCKSAQKPVESNNSETTSKAEVTPSTVQFIKMSELDATMAKEPRPVMIDMYTDWCGWCKKMDKATFHNAAVAKYVHENMYAVQFDAESTEEVTFKGEAYGSTGRSHSLARRLMNNRMSYPTIVYLDKNQDLITAVPGFKDANGFLIDLAYFAEGHYKTTSYEVFKRNIEGNN